MNDKISFLENRVILLENQLKLISNELHFQRLTLERQPSGGNSLKLRISNLFWNERIPLDEFVKNWLECQFFKVGRPYSLGIIAVYQLRRPHGQIPNIVVQFSSSTVLDRICRSAPKVLKGNGQRVWVSRFFGPATVKELYCRAAVLRQQFKIVKINWLNSRPFIWYGDSFGSLDRVFVDSPKQEWPNFAKQQRCTTQNDSGISLEVEATPEKMEVIRLQAALGSPKPNWAEESFAVVETGQNNIEMDEMPAWARAFMDKNIWSGNVDSGCAISLPCGKHENQDS